MVEGGDRAVEVLVVEFDDGAIPGEFIGITRYRSNGGKPPKGGANRDQRWEQAAAGGLGRLHPRRLGAGTGGVQIAYLWIQPTIGSGFTLAKLLLSCCSFNPEIM